MEEGDSPREIMYITIQVFAKQGQLSVSIRSFEFVWETCILCSKQTQYRELLDERQQKNHLSNTSKEEFSKK